MKYISELSKDTLVCEELLVKDYKDLLKCSYGETPNKIIFIEILCTVLANISNKPLSYIKSLNIIDLFCLLIDMRANSLGVCNVRLKQENQEFNVELNLNLIKAETAELFDCLSTVIEHDGIKIIFECPTAERLLDSTTEDYLPYIKGSYFIKNGKEHFVEINTNKQAELLFDRIPPKVSLKIIDSFNQFVEKITKKNYLAHYGFNEQKLIFIPSIDSLIWFTKLMFGEDLSSFYENLFYMSYTGRMNLQFLENSAIGEYNYYIGMLRQVIAAKNKQSSQGSGESYGEDPGEDTGLFGEM